MNNLIIILGLMFSAGHTSPEPKEANHYNKKAIAPTNKLQTFTYYVVNRRTGVPPRNAAEADQIASVSGPYGNVAYLGSNECRTWWLNSPVAGAGSVSWSYYYYAGGTFTTTSSNYLILFCPL